METRRIVNTHYIQKAAPGFENQLIMSGHSLCHAFYPELRRSPHLCIYLPAKHPCSFVDPDKSGKDWWVE